jgi:hypothetical protein
MLAADRSLQTIRRFIPETIRKPSPPSLVCRSPLKTTLPGLRDETVREPFIAHLKECICMGKFTAGDDDVSQDDFSAVLDVLAGPSLWHSYLTPNIATVKKNISSYTFRVESSDTFSDIYKNMDPDINYADLKQVWGVTDKWTETIYLRATTEKPPASYLLGALHECVHLVSAPVSPHSAKHSTARESVGPGVLEGLVEVVAEDVLTSQGIQLPADDLRGHTPAIVVARWLLGTKNVNLPRLAGLLFQGFTADFDKWARSTYGDNQWAKILCSSRSNCPVSH